MLKYRLATVWLVTSQRWRLDGFVARCLRRLLRIPASFVSRVSNTTVLAKARMTPFSQQMLSHQISFLRKVALSESGYPLRNDIFIDSTLTPQIGRFIRRVGRPRQDWTSQLLREGRVRFWNDKFQTFLSDCSTGAEVRWKKEVPTAFA